MRGFGATRRGGDPNVAVVQGVERNESEKLYQNGTSSSPASAKASLGSMVSSGPP